MNKSTENNYNLIIESKLLILIAYALRWGRERIQIN